jgi:hypothetical protein
MKKHEHHDAPEPEPDPFEAKPRRRPLRTVAIKDANDIHVAININMFADRVAS